MNNALENWYTVLGIDGQRKLLSPTKNNVLFAAGLFNMCFSLKSFSQIYKQNMGLLGVEVEADEAGAGGDEGRGEDSFFWVCF